MHVCVYGPDISCARFRGTADGSTIGGLAEIASYQMEYSYLGKITGKKEHVDRVSSDQFYFPKDRVCSILTTVYSLQPLPITSAMLICANSAVCIRCIGIYHLDAR